MANHVLDIYMILLGFDILYKFSKEVLCFELINTNRNKHLVIPNSMYFLVKATLIQAQKFQTIEHKLRVKITDSNLT
jgi:hypothetical protein